MRYSFRRSRPNSLRVDRGRRGALHGDLGRVSRGWRPTNPSTLLRVPYGEFPFVLLCQCSRHIGERRGKGEDREGEAGAPKIRQVTRS
jgi:hypothetical protein